MSHLDLANAPFQLIIRPWQTGDIVAREQSPPEVVEDLVDVLGNRLILCVVSASGGQVYQVAVNRLSDTGAGLGSFSLWVKQVFQVNQPLALPTRAFDLDGEGQTTFRYGYQTAEQPVVAFF
jgi:hypothetical protein